MMTITGTACTPAMPQAPAQSGRPSPNAEIRTGEDQEVTLREEGSTTTARTWINGSLNSRCGILFVSGVDGGYVEPDDQIYDRVATRFYSRGVPSVFVKYRNPGNDDPSQLTDSVEDAKAGAQLLRSLGASRIAILGWSFGGAVITNTPLEVPEIVTVIGFSPQSLNTEPVARFTTQSLLLFHSVDDENVPYETGANLINDEAPSSIRKKFVTLRKYNHALDGASAEVDPQVFEWLDRELPGDAGC
ncbi:MAG: alpha/beta hydrolase family protein [Bdellovibrionota bacterium]